MPINIKRTTSYTTQNIKILKTGQAGRFITLLPFNVAPIPLSCTPSTGAGAGSYDPPIFFAQSSYGLLTSSVLNKPFVYSGPNNSGGTITDSNGYLFNPATNDWDFQIGPDEISAPARGTHEAAGYDGKIFVIGGTRPGFPILSCSLYNYSSDCWETITSSPIPGFTGIRYNAYQETNTLAVNHYTNQVFIYGGIDLVLTPSTSFTLRNQLLVWNGSSISTVNSTTPVTFSGTVAQWRAYMSARDTQPLNPSDPRTKLMLHIRNSSNRRKDIYLWTQNQNSPVSGTWQFMTGSLGSTQSTSVASQGDSLNMPTAMTAVMWDRNYSRWTAVSMDPSDDPNIWTSNDDGATWSYGWYDSSELTPLPNFFLRGIEDPERSRMYMYTQERSFPGSVKYGEEFWRLDVNSNINNSTLTLISGTFPSSVNTVFSISGSRTDAVFGITSGSQPKLLVYGGTDGTKETPGGSGTRQFKGFVFDQSTSTWTSLSSYPTADVKKGRTESATAPLKDGKILVIGGRTGPYKMYSRAPLVNHLSSLTFDPSGNTWGSNQSLVGYSDYFKSAIQYENVLDTGGVATLAATDYTNGNVFLFGGMDSSGWKSQLSVYDYLSENWTLVESSSPIPSPVDNNNVIGSPTDHYSLAARNDGGNTKLMLFTGSYSSFTTSPDRNQALWLWSQTSSGPISGSWAFITGSGGIGETMPLATATLMYQDSQSRWVAMSNVPSASPNIWTSTNDGATWTAATYTSLDGWSKSGSAPFPEHVCASPASNEFYLFATNADGSFESFQVWKLAIDPTPASSVLTKIWP